MLEIFFSVIYVLQYRISRKSVERFSRYLVLTDCVFQRTFRRDLNAENVIV